MERGSRSGDVVAVAKTIGSLGACSHSMPTQTGQVAPM
jgi:hypothetical protein